MAPSARVARKRPRRSLVSVTVMCMWVYPCGHRTLRRIAQGRCECRGHVLSSVPSPSRHLHLGQPLCRPRPVILRRRGWPSSELLTWAQIEPDRPALGASAAGCDYTVVPIGDVWRAWVVGRDAPGRYRWSPETGMRGGRRELGRHGSESEAMAVCEQDALRRCQRRDEERPPIDIRISR